MLRTLQIMRVLVRSQGGRTSPTVRELALSLVGHLSPKAYAEEAQALHAYVRDRVRYVRDVRGVETVQTPERTIAIAQGDCDDKSTLLAAMLESLGFRTRFEAVGFVPGRWSHVLVSAFVAGLGWVPMETTLDVPMGWTPPRVVERITLEN